MHSHNKNVFFDLLEPEGTFTLCADNDLFSVKFYSLWQNIQDYRRWNC